MFYIGIMGGIKMTEDVLSTYVDRVTEVGNAGFNSQLLMDLLFQGISMIILIVLFVLIIRIGVLGIQALKIYIKNNSQ